MAEGEVSFTTEGIKPTKFESKPFDAGDYDLKLQDTFEIKKKNEPGALPYVNMRLTALGTAKDGGKDRTLFHRLFVSLEPGKDGVLNPYRANQVVGLARALGEEFRTSRIINCTNKNGGQTRCIDPRALVDWLKTKAGSLVRGHVKVVPAKDGYEAKNELSYFIAPESTSEVPEGFGNGATTDGTTWTPEGEA